ncbi:DUF2946 family protein [Curvibacter sp. APW13]|uniref:DUF2946 family protein n=1 Tax=Curvibacter sp. APW13 TaxID=3077236 RepID=UPI0028DD8805|nr:DUF2946 family protein [Curvibacter sp. APW13]MDT8990679.1 DUF2946 family protein [Curvibacter sp. APW13]
MDDIVKQAMAKWPHVPHCYGWLGLDARGNWYMRDERAQRQGAFASGQPGAKGAELKHDKLRAFIERNYGVDDAGCWYFQNGPQRVYVELESTPWVWRLQPGGTVHSHTGLTTAVRKAVLDEHGHLYLDTQLGFGIVHSQDVWDASECMERAHWTVEEQTQAELPRIYGYCISPQLQHGGTGEK